ncbi:polysaccharide deacetylase family protein [Cyanobium sp. ATX 6E8]|nr:polysaccharide deacetylase family protein [Cyanobium sp. ATX 6E8]
MESQLPAPGVAEIPQPLVQATPNGYQLGYDILGLTYWMLARCEEVNPPAELLDSHGRFPATSSHALRHGYLERPIVDEWLGVLRQLVQRIWPRLPLQEHQFRIVVSHDVDAPSAYGFGRKRALVRSMAARLLKHRDLAVALQAPRIRLASRRQLHPADPFNTFDWLMDQSDAAGIQSAFYFICGRTNSQLDAQYEPEHPAIRALMRRIHQRGHEIGLHPSYNTCHNPSAIASEAARLQRIATEEGIQQPEWGGRMHFLRWQWPTSAHGWEQAGFHYDSTLSYADRPGFRCGSCHAYPMFDPVAQRQLKLIQRPLVVMECSVIAERYLGLGYSHAGLALIQKLQQRCRTVGGKFTLLWHNSNITGQKDRDFYQKILTDNP